MVVTEGLSGGALLFQNHQYTSHSWWNYEFWSLQEILKENIQPLNSSWKGLFKVWTEVQLRCGTCTHPHRQQQYEQVLWKSPHLDDFWAHTEEIKMLRMFMSTIQKSQMLNLAHKLNKCPQWRGLKKQLQASAKIWKLNVFWRLFGAIMVRVLSLRT